MRAWTHITAYILDMAKAVRQLLVRLVLVVCDAVVSATTTMFQFTVPIMNKNGFNNQSKFVKPAYFTHDLEQE